uniref:Uncharacterized protein n=1 Tax=Schistosoma japonicum TaxID=6182 RepID=Q5C7Y7_SCHJA|nr:unknown [Schistosoma japonicum]
MECLGYVFCNCINYKAFFACLYWIVTTFSSIIIWSQYVSRNRMSH